jgi:hypothetical protein
MLIGLGTSSSVQQMIVNAANQYGVPPSIALGIAAHESGFNPTATNVNTNGTTDYGVMQLNTSVLQTYGLTPAQAFDPQTNIDTAMQLLGGYISKYGSIDTALQAYASGAGTVDSGSAPNATASQFISYVTGYTPDPSLGVSVDPSQLTSAPDPVTAAATDIGTAFSSGDFSSLAGSDWLVIGGGFALVAFLGYQMSRG